ncbi:hypothetical protein C9374_003626 [Naegleria lovaniensis]|uniref:Uncharacterized protein n=1 Tax=Naegleria lovaniensis TaxID=51637 RepID=A0AA88KS70_NAELO|nr:uncharacterized protein C9374_003626 [Naegleria lovaniensis]KAG2393862.1 hypothetical protein C9374_003626 [Naegleria lovaniensis]
MTWSLQNDIHPRSSMCGDHCAKNIHAQPTTTSSSNKPTSETSSIDSSVYSSRCHFSPLSTMNNPLVVHSARSSNSTDMKSSSSHSYTYRHHEIKSNLCVTTSSHHTCFKECHQSTTSSDINALTAATDTHQRSSSFPLPQSPSPFKKKNKKASQKTSPAEELSTCSPSLSSQSPKLHSTRETNSPSTEKKSLKFFDYNKRKIIKKVKRVEQIQPYENIIQFQTCSFLYQPPNDRTRTSHCGVTHQAYTKDMSKGTTGTQNHEPKPQATTTPVQDLHGMGLVSCRHEIQLQEQQQADRPQLEHCSPYMSNEVKTVVAKARTPRYSISIKELLN